MYQRRVVILKLSKVAAIFCQASGPVDRLRIHSLQWSLIFYRTYRVELIVETYLEALMSQTII